MPEYVNQVLAALARAGWEGYIVGGCVRDICLSRIPSDWDVCTPARPQQIKEALKDFRTIDTGIQHGTVTALSDGKPRFPPAILPVIDVLSVSAHMLPPIRDAHDLRGSPVLLN